MEIVGKFMIEKAEIQYPYEKGANESRKKLLNFPTILVQLNLSRNFAEETIFQIII